jgi:hypothetical protein
MTDGHRPVCLGVGLPSGAYEQILFSVWQLRVSWYGAPSLMRGWVCNLLVQLRLGHARAVTLCPSSAELMTIFCCMIWDFPNLEGQVPVFISQLYPVIPPSTGFHFRSLLKFAKLWWSNSNPPPHEVTDWPKALVKKCLFCSHVALAWATSSNKPLCCCQVIYYCGRHGNGCLSWVYYSSFRLSCFSIYTVYFTFVDVL